MNDFEVAILRVLIKRQQPVKLSILVGGFPDDCEDGVLSAVSNLRLRGYIILNDYQPNGYVSINRDQRKEILQIVDPDQISSDKLESSNANKNYYHTSVPTDKKKRFDQVITRFATSQTARTVVVSSLIIVGIVFALRSNIPTTSPDTGDVGPVVYYPHMHYKKWAESAFGAPEHFDLGSSYPSHAPNAATSVALKDCNRAPLQHQT